MQFKAELGLRSTEMKILHLINTLSAGGAELHLLALCRRLKRPEIELVVVCLREKVDGSRSLRADFEEEEIRIISLEANSRYDWRFFNRFAHLLKEERPDILHTHLPRADLAGAFGNFMYPPVAWVSSVHGIYSESWSGHWTLPLANFVWRDADSVIAISQTVKDWLLKQQRIPPNKVTVIYYGIDPKRLSEPDADLRKRWGLESRAVIGSVGRIEHGKGYDCLIQAMPVILERIPNACLLIAGHDPSGYGKNLERVIQTLGLKEYVRLVGFQDDVASFLYALDVFAFASRSEGFGQVVIEAMAAGKAVVAGRIPPLTEIIIDGETGLLVEPEDSKDFADAITLLLDQPERAKEMGRAGRERVQKYFSIERETSETLELYRTLIEPCVASAAG